MFKPLPFLMASLALLPTFSSADTSASRAKFLNGQVYFDHERNTRPSDMDFTKWSNRKKVFFDSQDIDADGVLSELDLISEAYADAEEFATDYIENLFTHWSPSKSLHLDLILQEIRKVASLDAVLGDPKEVETAITRSFVKLGLMQIEKDVYIKAEVNPESVTTSQTGAISRDKRAWMRVNVPFTLSVYYNEDTTVQSYEAEILVVRRFKETEDDSGFAVWGLSVASVTEPDGI